jgi:hypothetical protein
VKARLTTCLLLAALAAGCGSSGGSASTPPASSADGGAHRTSRAAAARAFAHDHGNAHFAMGTTIVITDSGFQPRILLAPMGYRVVWKNLSSRTQSVHLDNWSSAVDSGPIQPGHSWSFNPNAELSIIYHSTFTPRFHGQLQVQPIGNQ